MSLEGEIIGDDTEIKREEFVGRGRTVNEALENAKSRAIRKCGEEGYGLFSGVVTWVEEGNPIFYASYMATLIKHTYIRKEPMEVVTILPLKIQRR